MSKKRVANSVAVAAGITLLFAASALARTQSASGGALQAPTAASSVASAKADSVSLNDFDGLNLTDDQKAEIEKIHREIESNKAVVAKTDKLDADQKNAMLLGYTRIEYGRTFNVLTPEQRKEVRQKSLARRTGEQPAGRKQSPPGH